MTVRGDQPFELVGKSRDEEAEAGQRNQGSTVHKLPDDSTSFLTLVAEVQAVDSKQVRTMAGAVEVA